MSITIPTKSAKRGSTVKAAADSAPRSLATLQEKPAPRDRIVTMACELFREHGIRGIGVDAIAEAAETNKMTLYRHFGSKDDLICETLKRASQKTGAMWDELEARFPDDARGQLGGWVESLGACMSSEPYGCDLANAAIELKAAGHPAHAVIEDFKSDQRNRLTDLCREAGFADPELLADTLLMLLEGARVSRLSAGSEGPSKRFMSACAATIASCRVV